MLKKRFYHIVFLILIISSFYIIFKDRKIDPEIVHNDLVENGQDFAGKADAPTDFSRITFFNTSHKASLAIPDYWEGKYRLREKKDQAWFFYLTEQGSEIEMLEIRYLKNEDGGEDNKDYKIIKEDQNGKFVYSIKAKETYPETEFKSIEMLLKDVSLLLGSFKSK